MYKQYLENPFPILSLEEYVKITTKQIARLNPNIIIHRLAEDRVFDYIYTPKCPIKKLVVMNEIDKLLRNENIYQGDDFKSNHHR